MCVNVHAASGKPSKERFLAFAASIIESQQIGYFFDSQSNTVQRYDIESESWYSSILLQQSTNGPDVVHVDSDGIYAGFGQTLYRYHLDGTEKTHVINVRSPVVSIHSDGDVLFLNYSSSSYIRILSLDKSSNQVIDSVEISSYYYTDPPILSIATQGNTIYGVSSWYSSMRFFQISYNQDGTFGQNRISTSSFGEYINGRRSMISIIFKIKFHLYLRETKSQRIPKRFFRQAKQSLTMSRLRYSSMI